MSARTEPEPQAEPTRKPLGARVLAELRSWLWTFLVVLLLWMTIQSLRGGADMQGQAPDFALVDTKGQRVALTDLRGKPAVLYFWASWCTACKLTSPSIDAFARAHPDVPVLGIAEDEAADVQAYLASTPRTFRTALATQSITRAYRVRALPTTIVLDGHGKVVWSRVGVVLPFELGWHVPDGGR
ncbi:MAG: TlpA family protein disulfide reductase [Deltaproteobacteria bacterium]|nr:TlpA family protein disulfide reductase [Deltaproteobacteria bacterium]